eukprot:m.286908 g.286908  ORF g.286908 m.286908 type:complete len:119 (-) comp15784_c1_seq2:440-796(-)
MVAKGYREYHRFMMNMHEQYGCSLLIDGENRVHKDYVHALSENTLSACICDCGSLPSSFHVHDPSHAERMAELQKNPLSPCPNEQTSMTQRVLQGVLVGSSQVGPQLQGDQGHPCQTP